MKIVKRTGATEDLSFDKILCRIQNICRDFELHRVDDGLVAQKVIRHIFDNITSTQIDEETARIAANITDHLEYLKLAGCISVSNHHKNTTDDFAEYLELLHSKDLLDETFYKVAVASAVAIQERMDLTRDYTIDYFGFKTLEKSYLLKVDGAVVEKIGFMWMRVALAIHLEDLDSAFRTYDLLSQGYFTHASPTLFNAGTNRQQLSSCFLFGTDDSIEGIFKTMSDVARISKWAGGIGIHVSNVRCKGSLIKGTNGFSDGVTPMLKVYNEIAKYINQGSRRKGSIAIYLEPWHGDVEDFLELRKSQGSEEFRARDLFTALWIPDYFMRQVEARGKWYLMDPNTCLGLSDVHGEAFDTLYESYIRQKKYVKEVDAFELWTKILQSQIETGTPYLLYKDAANKKSNQANLGTIKSSNLCAEIIQHSDTNEVAVCNLASVALSKFVSPDRVFDFDKLHQVAKQITLNMNKIIDLNYYPIPETSKSNMRHRPIGIGVQGLADTYIKMRFPFESPEARRLNVHIFETIYHAALEASCELAQKHGSYSSFKGSPASRGILQFDMWVTDAEVEYRYDWQPLREAIVKHGLRNSLLTACMPTASTAQILGNNESIEPYTSNMYVRRVLSGEFIVINKHLVEDLQSLGLWNADMKNAIVAGEGSVRHIGSIPDHVRALYKTVWEISQRELIRQSAQRGRFIDQSQSLNLFLASPTIGKLTNMHMTGWKAGLKTGVYYLRTLPSTRAQQITVDPSITSVMRDVQDSCSLECMNCSA